MAALHPSMKRPSLRRMPQNNLPRQRAAFVVSIACFLFLHAEGADAQVVVRGCGPGPAEWFGSVDIKAAQSAWQNVSSEIQACFERESGYHISDLAVRCVYPNAAGISGPMNVCNARAKAELERLRKEAADQQAREAAALEAQKQAEAQQRARVAEEDAKKARMKDLEAKFGSNARDIYQGHIKAGMSRDEVVAARGKPAKTIAIPPSDEQWIYAADSVIFSSGKVTYVGK